MHECDCISVTVHECDCIAVNQVIGVAGMKCVTSVISLKNFSGLHASERTKEKFCFCFICLCKIERTSSWNLYRGAREMDLAEGHKFGVLTACRTLKMRFNSERPVALDPERQFLDTRMWRVTKERHATDRINLRIVSRLCTVSESVRFIKYLHAKFFSFYPPILSILRLKFHCCFSQ